MGYFYLYDSFLQDRAYLQQLISLENILTDLGIQGRVGRLTLLKSLRNLIEQALREGADTVVAVGNDDTLSQTAQIIANYPGVTLGFIPLGEKNQTLAPLLGIPLGLIACQVLSGRTIMNATLGLINKQYFLRSIHIVGKPLLESPNKFNIQLSAPHAIVVCNLDKWGEQDKDLGNPTDNTLELILIPLAKKSWLPWRRSRPLLPPTIIPFEKLIINNKTEILITVDGQKIIKSPATVEVAPHRLRIIVGKTRMFY